MPTISTDRLSEKLHLLVESAIYIIFLQYIPVIFQVASLLVALTYPGHIVIYAPRDLLPCRCDVS